MDVPTLLKKELLASRHRAVALLVLLLVLPGFFAYGTLFFEHTLPEHTPVAVVPADGNVTQDDLDVVIGALTFFSDPVVYDSRTRAFDALTRERVYAVVEVPEGLTESGRRVTVDVSIHGSVAPYRVPSRALVSILSVNLDRAVPASVGADRHVVGEKTPLSEYLLPTFLLVVVMLVAFTYLPYDLARERDVLDRLRFEASLESVVTAKLAFLTPLILPTVLAVHALGNAFGYSLEPLSIPFVGVYLLTFLYLAAISVSVMFLTGFSTLGRVLNVAIFFALVPLSNLAYPVGFFSPWSRVIARHNPLHYSAIIARSHVLKDVPDAEFATWFAWLAGIALLALLGVKLSIVVYERRYQ